MADEPLTAAPAGEDPMAALLRSHITRMEAISDDGYARSQEMSEELVAGIRKGIGLRTQLRDRVLTHFDANQKTPA